MGRESVYVVTMPTQARTSLLTALVQLSLLPGRWGGGAVTVPEPHNQLVAEASCSWAPLLEGVLAVTPPTTSQRPSWFLKLSPGHQHCPESQCLGLCPTLRGGWGLWQSTSLLLSHRGS